MYLYIGNCKKGFGVDYIYLSIEYLLQEHPLLLKIHVYYSAIFNTCLLYNNFKYKFIIQNDSDKKRDSFKYETSIFFSNNSKTPYASRLTYFSSGKAHIQLMDVLCLTFLTTSFNGTHCAIYTKREKQFNCSDSTDSPADKLQILAKSFTL